MNHTIRLPVECTDKFRVTIISASQSKLYLLLRCNYTVSVWTGHPLIPDSWKELCSQSIRVRNVLSTSTSCVLSSDGRSFYFGYCRLTEFRGIGMDVQFKHYDIASGQWTDLCSIDGVSLQCFSLTSIGCLALTRDSDRSYLHLVSEGEAVLLKSFDGTSQEAVFGADKLYIYSKLRATVTVYSLDSLDEPQVLACQEQLQALYESDGQIYTVEQAAKESVVHRVHMEDGVCKLQRDLVRSRLPVRAFFYNDPRPSTVDSSYFYSVSCTDRRVHLSSQSHSKPLSLQTLAVLGVQKLFGVKREFKYNMRGRTMLEGDETRKGQFENDRICDVWEGGITSEKFRERFGCHGKMF